MTAPLPNQTISKIYYIPKLETELAYCLGNRTNWRNPRHEKLTASLALIKNEINYELDQVGRNNFPEVERLAIGKFDSTVYAKSMKFLSTLKLYYAKKQTRAMQEKEALIAVLTDTPQKAAKFADDAGSLSE